jgi:hypothetical protein
VCKGGYFKGFQHFILGPHARKEPRAGKKRSRVVVSQEKVGEKGEGKRKK